MLFPNLKADHPLDRTYWDDDASWRQTGVGTFYCRKSDPRVVVLKRNPAWGYTLNWGHPFKAVYVLASLAMALFVLIFIFLFGGNWLKPPVLHAMVVVGLGAYMVLQFKLMCDRVSHPGRGILPEEKPADTPKKEGASL